MGVIVHDPGATGWHTGIKTMNTIKTGSELLTIDGQEKLQYCRFSDYPFVLIAASTLSGVIGN
jgi:hypothetical protein